MRDNLEQFIQNNRKEFDKEIPSLKVWAALDKQLASQTQKAPPRRIFSIAKMAASVLLILSIGLAGGYFLSQQNAAQDDAIAEQFPEFGQMQEYYTQQVSEKLGQLQQYNYVDGVNEDLIRIDGFIEDLRIQLEAAPRGSEETIINAMIQNYKTKLGILERILSRIETRKNKKQKVDENESVDI